MDSRTMFGCTVPAIGPVPADTALTATSAIPADLRGVTNPRNPLFWFGAILLATVGAAGMAGSVRLGPAKLSGSLGKS